MNQRSKDLNKTAQMLADVLGATPEKREQAAKLISDTLQNHVVEGLTMQPKVQFKKLDPHAILPAYQSEGASGFDLHVIEDICMCSGDTRLLHTGLACAIDQNILPYLQPYLSFEMQIRPRSGLSLKTGLRVANAPGTIDCDYRGEICIIAHNADKQAIVIHAGDRVAQGVICPVLRCAIEEVVELDDTERGARGFGSSGVSA